MPFLSKVVPIDNRGIVKQARRLNPQMKSVTHSNEILKRNRRE
ncbi:hypothetical protein [Lysinibacillus sp. 38-6]